MIEQKSDGIYLLILTLIFVSIEEFLDQFQFFNLISACHK